MGLLDGLDRVVREPWYSRGPRKAPIAAISLWAATRTGTIGDPSWTCVGLHAVYAQLVRTSLGYREGYRSGGCGGPRVTGRPSQTASQTAFGHRLCLVSWKTVVCENFNKEDLFTLDYDRVKETSIE